MVDLVDRFRGSILGLAVGDAIGHPTEFISSVERIKAKYGPQGVTGFMPSGSHKAGTFTDDTQMTVSVARALIRAGALAKTDLDALMKLMGDEFVAWADHPSNNRAPGGTCLAGCRKLKQGAAWRDAGVKESKGCGAAMRAAPVGLYFYDDDDAMVRVAAAQSVLTHSHPTGIASSVAAAAPVAWVAKGNSLDGVVEYTKAMVSKLTPEMLRDLGAKESDIESIGIKEQLEILDDTSAAVAEDADDVCSLLGGAWVGEEAVACALWCVLKAKGDFAESVLRGANSSGDSDSIACIAGSIAGALGGLSAIKGEWVAGVERSEDLDALAKALFEAKSTGKDTPSIAGRMDFFDAEKPKSRTAVTSIPDADATEEWHDPDETPDDADDAGDEDEEPVGAAPAGALLGPTVLELVAEAKLTRLPDLDALSVEELEKEVARHNRLYWELAAPVISDVDFDRLCRALVARKPDSRALQHLGARPDAFSAVKHREPMLSLDKCYEEPELEKWSKELACDDVLAMPKIDGLACSLRYDASGNLEVAATRGDGEEGEDITPNARAVSGIPSMIPAQHAPIEVRGEVFMSLPSFEKRRAEAQAGTSNNAATNPRNLAAGALRQKDPNATRRAELSFLAYDVKSDAFASGGRQRDKLALVKELGFAPAEHVVVEKKRAIDAVRELSAKRAELGYETDGVVVMADSVEEQKRLGATAHHPRWAIAWKFQGEEGTSVLRGIEWSVARTGTITPVALVEPVQLSGVTVMRATLHHMGFVRKLGLHIGAKIAMVRRGGVIPHVEHVIEVAREGAQSIEPPAACPACNAKVVEDGDFLVCSNPTDCIKARVGRLLHFLEACDIQGLGDVIVEEAVQKSLLRSPVDLFRVTAKQLASLDKCGEKTAAKIVNEVEKAKSMPLDVLLRSLGIANLGKTAARALAERYGSLAKVRALGVGEISQIKGFGDVIAQSIVDGLRENSALLDELTSLVTVLDASSSSASSSVLAGKSFVFTGKLRIDRKQAEAKVKSLGATVPSGVTKTLTYLVVGDSDRDQPSTKQKAAEKLVAEGSSLQIIDETAFEKLLAALPTETAAPTPAPTTATPTDTATSSTNAITELPVTMPSPATIVPEAASSPDPIAETTTATTETEVKPDPKKRQLSLF